jgi:hypothetical protein
MRRPRFIAEHARNAHGVVGRAIAWIMERETSRENLRSMRSASPRDIACSISAAGRGEASKCSRGARQTYASPASMRLR